MGNNLNRKSGNFNCFNTKSANSRSQMKQSFSYDSGTRLNLLSKMKNSFKSGGFAHRRVPKSNTDENFLVIDEPQTECNLEHIDELFNYERDDYIDEIERQVEKPPGRFKKSPAIYNIQSIENDDVKISDLVSHSTTYSFEKDNCSNRTSVSDSSLTIDSNCSLERPERKKFSPSMIKKLIIRSLNKRRSSRFSEAENSTVQAFNGFHGNQDAFKYIDDSVSCVLRESSSSSLSLTNSQSMSKSQTNLDTSPHHNSSFSFKILNDVNRKLNRIQHLKKKRNLKCAQDVPLANERSNYLNELHSIKLDFADNISVYTLFNSLNKQAPFASSENTTISTSVDLLDCQSYSQNSFSSLSLLNN